MSSVSYPSLWQIPQLSRRYASRKNRTWCEPDRATLCSVLTTTRFRFGHFYFSQTLGRQKSQWLRLLKPPGYVLVGGLEHFFFPYERFFRGVGIPPTRCSFLMSPSPFCCETQPAMGFQPNGSTPGGYFLVPVTATRWSSGTPGKEENARNGGCKPSNVGGSALDFLMDMVIWDVNGEIGYVWDRYGR